MFQFLQPIALISIAALAIPVLVHLWHTRKGKVVKVGSIRLFTAESKQRSSSRTIHNWPLFITRCLLLLSLALLLAKPYLGSKENKSADTGWIITGSASLGNIYSQHRPLLDSLLDKGYTFHAASPGFPQLVLADSSSAADTMPVFSAWTSIRELNGRLPDSFPVLVFTPDQLSLYTGNRPATNLHVSIRSIRSEDTASNSSTAYFTSDEKTRTQIYTSSSNGNYYRQADTILQNSVTPDTSIIRIGIYPGKNRDATYVSAAISAIREYTKRRISLQVMGFGEKPDGLKDLLFVLDTATDIRPSLSLVKEKGTLFVYMPSIHTPSRLLVNTGTTPLDKSNPVYVSSIAIPGAGIKKNLDGSRWQRPAFASTAGVKKNLPVRFGL